MSTDLHGTLMEATDSTECHMPHGITQRYMLQHVQHVGHGLPAGVNMA